MRIQYHLYKFKISLTTRLTFYSPSTNVNFIRSQFYIFIRFVLSIEAIDVIATVIIIKPGLIL